MQNAPKMKGSGLNPEPFKTDEVVHVFGTNIKEKIDEATNPISFDIVSNQDTKQQDDIESIKKRKFDARTGEEDEETVFQADFKLFSWDLATSNWIEKGRGLLKLNDSLDTQNPGSRLIMRISGTLRIILNVAIRHPTFKVITNTKTSLRFTDSQTVWAASGNNAHQLRELIEERLKYGKRLRSDDVESESNESNVVEDRSPKLSEPNTTAEADAPTDSDSENETETKDQSKTKSVIRENEESNTSTKDSDTTDQSGASPTKDKTVIEDTSALENENNDASGDDNHTHTGVEVEEPPESTPNSPVVETTKDQTEVESISRSEKETKEEAKPREEGETKEGGESKEESESKAEDESKEE